MPAHHGKQKQLAKRKKKRENAQRKARPAPLGTSQAELVREAALLPQGPAFLSGGWKSTDAGAPQLVTAVVTRVAPGGILIPSIALVDRTCLGIKNAFLATPTSRANLDGWLDRIAAAHGSVEEADLLTVQSIVYHAVDYARSLGFEPHPDFPEPLFGPRPDTLLDTPLAHPARPVYVSGPADDPLRIVQKLAVAVGPGNFDVVVGAPPTLEEEEDEGDE